MLSIYDRATLDTALVQAKDPKLRSLIASRWELAEAVGLAELTHMLIVQPGDDEAAIGTEIGFSPLVSPVDGARYGEADFQPYWAWLRDVGSWFEMIVTVGDSGFAFILLIDGQGDGLPDLQRLCGDFGR